MTTPPPGPAEPTLTIHQGQAILLFAFDIGHAIDLDKAQSLAASAGAHPGRPSRAEPPHAQRTPEYFEFRPAPLQLLRPTAPRSIAARPLETTLTATLYDFGGCTIAYRLPIDGPLQGLVDLADELYEHHDLLTDARAQAQAILTAVTPAVDRPGLSPLVEDYVIYHLQHTDAHHHAAQRLRQCEGTVARILRAERGPLSPQETAEALSTLTTYAPADALVIDWNAAILLQEPAHDITAALQFANQELLEMRFLDDRLDALLDRAASAQNAPGSSRRAHKADLRRIAALQMDAALMFESVNNAIKLLGDAYLARVYRLAAQRFHLADWDASITRKLSTIDALYRKTTDDEATARMELLEWIIILLIAVSIILPFVTSAAK